MSRVAIWGTAFQTVGTEMGVSLKYLRCKKEASMSGINEETDVGKDIVRGGIRGAGRGGLCRAL